MKVVISRSAQASVKGVIDFIESKNIAGSGQRWAKKLVDYLETLPKSHNVIPLCKYPPFRELELKCVVYNDWVVAFLVTKSKLKVVAFVYGENLVY